MAGEGHVPPAGDVDLDDLAALALGWQVGDECQRLVDLGERLVAVGGPGVAGTGVDGGLYGVADLADAAAGLEVEDDGAPVGEHGEAVEGPGAVHVGVDDAALGPAFDGGDAVFGEGARPGVDVGIPRRRGAEAGAEVVVFGGGV